MNKNISTVIAVIFVTLIMFSLTGFYIFIVNPAINSNLNRGLQEKVKVIAELSKPHIEKAIKSQDDILMLSQVENIMKTEDITTAYVLDPSGKVITHNNISEWGKTYSDELNKKAITSANCDIVTNPSHNGNLYFSPMVSSMTLCVGFSNERIDKTVIAIQKKSIAAILVFSFVSAIMVWFFISSKIKISFETLNKMIKSAVSGTVDKIETNLGGEFTATSELINELIAKTHNTSHGIQVVTNQCDSSMLLNELSRTTQLSLLFLNAENKVSFINDHFLKAFASAEKDLMGKHIIELDSFPYIIELVKKTSSAPLKSHETIFNNKPIKAIPFCHGILILY